MAFYVYILASRKNGALYTGNARDLRIRVEQHQSKAVKGHTAKYNIQTLVWFETHETLEQALIRERQIKRWRRAWKVDMIEQHNTEWADISDQIPY